MSDYLNKRNRTLKLKAKVIKYYDGIIDVSINKQAACGDCSICFKSDPKKLKIPVEREFNKEEMVLIELPCWLVLRLSMLFYFIPAVMALTGFMSGYNIYGNLGGFAGAFIFLVLTYLAVRRFTKEKYNKLIKVSRI